MHILLFIALVVESVLTKRFASNKRSLLYKLRRRHRIEKSLTQSQRMKHLKVLTVSSGMRQCNVICIACLGLEDVFDCALSLQYGISSNLKLDLWPSTNRQASGGIQSKEYI